ncbi:OmpA family protein [Psychroflexus sp. YR1-1]|uniref:OmpA family protein n=1 Tax=Psychroflexus aurantiacus TaxID=2709310 RepID=A0A6B3R3B4_9FLAO|nr:OmpA family protein [Psychroflexus aurantiacus]NEV93597.1 OmpA family protein [Psychroflexus aurantiacus]
MRPNFNHIFYLLAILISCMGHAQVEKLKAADEMFEGFAFVDAQKIYLEVARTGYESENLFKKLGDSYYFNNDLEKAFEWYDKLYELNPDQSKDYLFKYAQSLKSVKQYEQADQIMLAFNALNQNDSRVSRLKSEGDYLEIIEMQSGRFRLDSVPVNTEYSEFSPSFYKGRLVFASNRPVFSIMKRIDEWSNQPYLNLYSVELSDSLEVVSEPVDFLKSLNSKFHEASPVFTKDGKTVYFTRNNFVNNKLERGEDGVSRLKLFKSEWTADNTWSKPQELPFNSDNYSVAHPALSSDEKTLYFSSDMPGTRGMSDIFKVDILDDSTYGAPKNLGDSVNTEGRESFAFASENDLLYFSSDGHLGLGGLDVFVVAIDDEGEMGEVFNIGEPVNSNKDDFSFIINSKLGKGFFASNRGEINASDDLYSFKQLEDLMTACFQYVKGKIYSSGDEENLSGAKVELLDEDLNLLQSTETNSEGEYQFEIECNTTYVVRVSKEEFSTSEEFIQTNTDFDTENTIDFTLETGVELGITEVVSGDDLSDLLQLDPIYFDFDAFQIRSDAEIELQKIIAVMKSYPELRIEVGSHTDSLGDDLYNELLSEKRATATMNYLVDIGGIDRSRISAKGYGESQLVNECSNDSSCTKDEHDLNRRSEFIILNENVLPEDKKEE